MTFRVIGGNGYQGGEADQGDKPGDLPARVIDSPPPRPATGTALDASSVGNLLERLENLSYTFEAMNASSRTYAAEAVLETLARMERRDLQALAAIEAFASALKTVSQHLAGLRNAVQTTAQDTAAGLEVIGQRLSVLEGRAGLSVPDQSGALEAIAQRLASIEHSVAEVGDPFDVAPLQEMLETIARRVARIEKKVGDIPTQMGEPFDPTPITVLLETVARRLSRVEKKVDKVDGVDTSAIAQMLETIARRVSRVEKKVDDQANAEAAAAAPVDFGPMQAAMETIARRVSRVEKKLEAPPPPAQIDTSAIDARFDAVMQRVAQMEAKVDSGADGHSLAACLMAVDRRLSRIESGMGMDVAPRPVEPQVAPPPAPQLRTAKPLRVQPLQVKPAAAPAAAPPAAPAAKDVPAEAPAIAASAAPAPQPEPAPEPAANPDEQGSARQRVDLLLEQVFRVLSR